MRFILSISFLCFFCSSFAQKEIKYAAVVENGWWKIINEKGNLIVDSLGRSNYSMFINEHSVTSEYGIFAYMRDYKFGFKDYNNKVIVPGIYDRIYPFINGFAKASIGSIDYIIDTKGKIIASSVGYDYMSDVSEEGLIVVRKGEDIACLNTKGETVVPFYYKTDAKYYSEPKFEDGLLRVMVKQPNMGRDDTAVRLLEYLPRHLQKHNFKIGFINSKGKLVIDTIYRLQEAIIDYRDRQSLNWNQGACGTGREVAEHYERKQDTADRFILANEYYHFDGGICLVKAGGKNVVINTNGDSLFSVAEDKGVRCSQGYILIESVNNIFGNYRSWATIINAGGKVLYRGSGRISEYKWLEHAGIVIEIPVEKSISDINPRRSYKLLNTETGVVSEDSFMMVYTYTGAYARGFPFEKRWGKSRWRVIDRYGNILRHLSSEIIDLKENANEAILVAQNTNDKKGYVNRSFKWVIEPVFDDARIFSNGLAEVKGQDNKWGYINDKGKMIIPAKYDQVTPFQSLKIP